MGRDGTTADPTGSVKASEVLEATKRERSLFERILTVFPGYRGYKQKELLRETDKLVRDIVFRNMKQASDAMRELYRESVSASGLSPSTKRFEQLSMRCDTIGQRIRHATHGYAPFAHVIRVQDEALLRLMEFDAGLADGIEKLKADLNDTRQMALTDERITQIIEGLRSDIVNVENLLAKRQEALFGLQGASR